MVPFITPMLIFHQYFPLAINKYYFHFRSNTTYPKTPDPDMNVFLMVYFLIAILALILNLLGLYLLLTQKRKSFSDLCLIHLSMVEIALYTFDVSYKTKVIVMIGEFSHPDHFLWKKTVILVLGVAQYLSVMLLTTDRILAVRLGLKYKLVMTRNKFLVSVSIIWSISVLHSPYYLLFCHHNIYLIWYTILVAFLVISYSYIISSIKTSARKTSQDMTNGGQIKVKYEVPFLIILTITCLYFVPEILMKSGIHTIWYHAIWALNFFFDPIIYIFGSLTIRRRLCQCWKGDPNVSVVLTIDAASIERMRLSLANKAKRQKESTETLESRISGSSLQLDVSSESTTIVPSQSPTQVTHNRSLAPNKKVTKSDI